MTQAPHKSDSKHLIALALGMAFLALFLVVTTPSFDPTVPLPWDMSHHYLGALEFRDALKGLSPSSLGKALLGPDLYPPGHSVILGTWLLLGGESAWSIRLFQWFTLWMFVPALLWTAQSVAKQDAWKSVVVGCLLLGACSRLVALAGTFLVDAVVAMMAILSLATLARLKSGAGRLRYIGAFTLTSATLLTKYNVGLPLVPCTVLLAGHWWINGDRRTAIRVLAVGIAALATWAAFLSLQTGGWTSFARFAENRANSLDWSWGQRLRWYFDLIVNRYFAHAAVGWASVILAGCALVRFRTPAVVAMLGYVTVSAVALGRHPYLLDRNIVATVAVLVVLASLGATTFSSWVSRMIPGPGRVALTILVTSAAVVALIPSVSSTRSELSKEFNANAAGLVPISEFIEARLREYRSCKVVGTFNAFSPGWVEILSRRIPEQSRARLTIGFPYPLEASRTGRKASPDEAYLKTIRQWNSAERPEIVVGIDVLDGSPFFRNDYLRWGAWKKNLVAAIRNSPDARLESQLYLDSERVLVQAISLGHAPIEYTLGWGAEEPWGRWASSETATIRIPAPAAGCEILAEVAAFEGLKSAQVCRISCGSVEIASFEVWGNPWKWQTIRFRLPESLGSNDANVTFAFSGLHPGNAGDSTVRALPFRTLLVTSPEHRR